MNTLSVLIYLSSVSQSLVTFLAIISFISFIISVIFGAIAIVNYVNYKEKMSKNVFGDYVDNLKEISNIFRKLVFRFTLPLAFLCAILAIALPNKQTVLLIAASEYGERIMNSERVNALVDPSIQYLQNWLRNEVNKFQQESTPRR